MQKGKIQRKVGIVRWRERERERERRERESERGERAETSRKLKWGGLRSDRRESGWIQLTMMTWAREVFDESLVDAAESGESAFPSNGNFSVSRSCRPFSVSHASEQLSLVRASREGPINFPFKFSGWQTCGATGGKLSLRELKINLHQWEPCMNHSLRSYGDDCKPSKRTI